MPTGKSSMADGRLSTGKPKRQDSPTSEANPSKLYSKSRAQSHLLFRALIAALLFIVIPMLPSIAPDSLSPHNPFSFTPQSWELLHLILVGIAVSYGLFSRRSNDSEEGGGSNPKFDSSSSSPHASKLLQVASLFDEEGVDSSPLSSSGSSWDDGRNKFRAWSSQYYRNEPSTMVVLPKKSAEQLTEHLNSFSSSPLVRDDERPLLLPIRSLKSPVSDANVGVSDGDIRRTISSPASASGSNSTEDSDGPRTKTRLGAANSSGVSGSYSTSNSSLSSDSTDLNEGTNDVLLFGGGLQEECCNADEESAVVLPSPIPWRSRSTSTTSQIREMIQQSNNNNIDNTDQFFWSHTQSSQLSSASSTIKVSPFSSSSTPKSSSPNKPRPPPSTSSQAKSIEDLVRRKSIYKSPPPTPTSSLQSAGLIGDEVSVRKDFKHKPQGFCSDGQDYLVDQGTALPELAAKERTKFDSSSAGVGKYLRTMKAVGDSAPVSSITQERVVLGEEEGADDWKTVSTSEEDAQVTLGEKTDGNLHGNASIGSSRTSSSLPHNQKETKDFFDQVLVETDDDEPNNSEMEEGNGVESENAVTRVSSSTNDVGDDGPDVDKKADEFIARFREQIRLQRIESIKRSSGQFSRNK